MQKEEEGEVFEAEDEVARSMRVWRRRRREAVKLNSRGEVYRGEIQKVLMGVSEGGQVVCPKKV